LAMVGALPPKDTAVDDGPNSRGNPPVKDTEVREFESRLRSFAADVEKPYDVKNRIRFLFHFFYDVDHSGYLDLHDFEVLSLRITLFEGHGRFNEANYTRNKDAMNRAWNQIAELADSDQDGKVIDEEFILAIRTSSAIYTDGNIAYVFKGFINKKFKNIDIDGDGLIGHEEYRLDCVKSAPYTDIEAIDHAYRRLRRLGPISLAKYQEIYVEFLTFPHSTIDAVYLFGPPLKF